MENERYVFPYKLWRQVVAIGYDTLSQSDVEITTEFIRRCYHIPSSLKYCHEDERQVYKMFTFFGFEK